MDLGSALLVYLCSIFVSYQLLESPHLDRRFILLRHFLFHGLPVSAIFLEPFEAIKCLYDEPSHDLVKIEATFGSSKRISCHRLKAVIFRVHQPLLRKEFESTLNLRMVCYRRPTVKQDFRPIDLFSFDEGFSLGSFVAGVKGNISEGLALQIWVECVAHQMFIVLPLALSFIPIGSKLIESPLKVVLLLDFPVIDFVFPVVPEVGEYFPFHLAELDFMEFVGIHGLVESSVPFPHVVDFHQLEMSLLHLLAKLL